MALYVVGQVIVRARNGNVALTYVDGYDGPVFRLDEAGPPGIVTRPDDVETESTEPIREVEVTSLEDKGKRKFLNRDTGETRTEDK